MTDRSSKQYIFRFKQFAIRHCSSAMKVGTDGVLLGAWTTPENAGIIWDIGCGSGLISLMLAQRCNARIIGIEIDPDAAAEARLNAESSPWADRISIITADASTALPALPAPDLIVSNPPFFTESLKAPDKIRSVARHEGTLGVESLIEISARHLSPAGRLCFIAPTERTDDIELFSTVNRLHTIRRTDIRTTEKRNPVRTLWEISRNARPITYETKSLRDEGGDYSQWYRSQTEDYYTHLK